MPGTVAALWRRFLSRSSAAGTESEVPTTAEVGYPKVLSDNWYGLIAPVATPAEVVQKLNAATNAALKSPETIKLLDAQGTLPSPGTQAEFAAALRDEKAKWAPIVKANNIRLE